MGISFNNVGPALLAQRTTDRATNRLNRGLGQLASGLRINQASVDAAGLAIAERFRTSIRQANQEIAGIQNGISAVQTAEAALGTQSDAIGRIRELAVQASNGTLTDDQRAAINEEAQQLLQEIDATAQNTEFNGQALLDGSAGPLNIDVEGTLQVNVNESTTDSLGIGGVDLSTEAGANAALGLLDNAAIDVNQNRASLGAQQNRFESAIQTREVQVLNETESESRIRDLNIAQAVIERNRNQLLQQAGIAGIVQGNLQNQTALTLLGG